MTFERSWVLLLLVLPALFTAWQWRVARPRAGLVLKVAMMICVLLALAEPRMAVPQTKVATAVLVDTSASVSASDLERASGLVSRISGASGRHWMTVMPFARGSRAVAAAERGGSWKFQPTAGEAGRGTNLEAAVRDGIAALPAGMSPRLVLISDGNENDGSIARAAALAAQLRVPVDTYPLAGLAKPLLRIEAVTLPSTVFTGERFPIDLVVSAPEAADARVDLMAEGKTLGTSPVQLRPGENQVRVHARLNVAGAVEVSGRIDAGKLGAVHFDQALTLRRPKVLFVSQDPAGTESHLLETLAAAQFDVQRTSDPVSGRLEDFQLVVLNNQDLEAIQIPRKAALEEYVKQGGGLLVIGGERNVYAEGKKVEDALDRTLPAKLAPPRSPEGTCVILIVDKSSSMEGRKMELARVAAIGVIDNLRPVDQVGVLIFDNSFQWAVPIRRAEDRGTIKRLVAGITPDGGTQIAPALAEAYRRSVPVVATYKHIVLLTDGISEEGDSISLAKEATTQKVTISTVGLGQDVNRAYLEKIAVLAKGRSYFLTDPSGLEQILLKDVKEHTGSTAVEKPIVPAVMKQAAVLEGVGIESAPPLKGYVKFEAKPTADVILAVDKKDPLLVSWQLGLGRSAVFTSDAKSRWAEAWVSWPGFDKFWVNVFRDLLPHAQPGESTVSYDNATGKLIVDYRLAPHLPEPARVPQIFVFGPAGFQQPVAVRKVAARSYRGEVAIGSRQGLFRVRPVEESREFPETGLYREEEETTQYGANEALLRQVSAFTGGRFSPEPAQVFQASGAPVYTTLQLWPALLGAAVALSLAELILRKWSSIVYTFSRKQ